MVVSLVKGFTFTLAEPVDVQPAWLVATTEYMVVLDGVTDGAVEVEVIGDQAKAAVRSQPKRTSGRLVPVAVAVVAANTVAAEAPSTRYQEHMGEPTLV